MKKRWHQENGTIYFTAMSNNRSGRAWIKHFRKNGRIVSGSAKTVVESSDFRLTKGEIKIVVLKGAFFSDDELTIENIRARGAKFNLMAPNTDVACLIYEKFTNEELKAMGLRRIIVMHEPIEDIYRRPLLLDVNRRHNVRELCTSLINPDNGHGLKRNFGFAFMAPLSWKQPCFR